MTITDITIPQVAESPSIPFSREDEEAVIGSILINPEMLSPISLILVDGSVEFYIHRNRYIFEAFLALGKSGKPLDLLTASDELKRQGLLEEIGGSAYLTALINAVPTSLNAESYAKVVHGNYIRRRLLNSANEIANIAYADNDSPENIIAKSINLIQPLIAVANEKTSVTINESALEMDRQAVENATRSELPGIPTGIIDLDKLFGGGMQNSDLLLVSARPGQGKTSLLIQCAVKAARVVQGAKIIKRRVGIFSMEMPHVQLTTRMLSQLTGIDYQSIRSGRIPENRYASTDAQMGYYDALDYLSNLEIEIDDAPARTPEDIAARCEVWSAKDGLDVIFIDSLNLMRSLKNFGNRKDKEFDDNATLIKETIARKYDIPVLMAHQMNRSIESRGEDSEPTLADLREGGEQPADVVLFIHNKMEGKMIKDSKLVLAKHRNGPTGIIPVVFRSEYTRFENCYIQRFN